ncbi:MAG: protein adenylyltransferase SelO family protein, partial [Cytophagales bacterium]
ENQKVDVQLKGSGETPYSRRGDGKATLRSMLREYIVSEAMFGLNIPTTRSLAVVKTGDEVYREYIHEGAVLTRIAQSHIRVGTFEFATRNLNKEEFKTFADYVIERHFPELSGLENPYLELLKSVMFKQIDLIVEWMRVGFIHGVMNTDNMSIAGETIDYGPCAFMNAYHPETVFSSIDKQGRYSFGNQPGIAQWNIAVFAGSLLPLIDEDSEKALSAAQAVVNQFPAIFQNRWMKMMGKKMGFNSMGEKEQKLVVEFLELLQECKADYTNSFLFLMGFELTGIEALKSNERFLIWKEKWKNEVMDSKTGELMNGDDMKKSNPKIIPRNHLVENVLNKAEMGNYEELHDILNVLNRPYGDLPEQFYTSPPKEGDLNYKTYCGT